MQGIIIIFWCVIKKCVNYKVRDKGQTLLFFLLNLNRAHAKDMMSYTESRYESHDFTSSISHGSMNDDMLIKQTHRLVFYLELNLCCIHLE